MLVEELEEYYSDGTLPAAPGGDLAVSLSAETPAAANIPKTAQSVRFLQMILTGGASDSVISSLTVKRSGLGDRDDFDKVWAEKDGTRITSQKSINTSDEAILIFSPVLEITAGEAIYVDIVASVNGTAGHYNGFEVSSASAITSDGTVSGSFPIAGNSMSLVDYSVVKALFNNEDTSANTVKVGDEKAELGRFSVKADGNKDLVFKSIRFKQIGNATLVDTLTDLYFERSGSTVTESAVIAGKYVTFTFADGGFTIEDGETETFRVKASVIGQESGHNTVQFKVDNKEDLVAEEVSTGFVAKAVSLQLWNGTTTWSACEEANAEDNYATLVKTTIDAGVVTVAKKSESPSAANYTKGTNGVVGLIANIKADEAFTADSIRIDFAPKTLLDETENLKVYVNDILLDAVDPVTADETAGYIVIDSAFTVEAGDNEVKVVFDIKTTADDEELTVKLVGGANLFGSPEYVSNGDAVNTADISGTATGGKVTVKAAAYTATRSDGFSNDRLIIQGSTDVVLAKITMKALYDDITFTSTELAANSGADVKVADVNISDMKLYVDNEQIGETKNFSSGSSFSLGSTEFVITKDTSKILEIRGSFSTAAAVDEHFKTVVSFEAEDSQSKSLTVTPTATTTQFKIAESGSLAVVKGGDTPSAALVAANNNGVELAEFKLTATNDSIDVYEIYMSNLEGTGADARVSSVELYKGSALLDSDVPTNGEVRFIISEGELEVPKNDHETITVKVNLNQIEEASQTDKDIKFTITKIKAKSSAGVDLTATYNPTVNFTALQDGGPANVIIDDVTGPTANQIGLGDATFEVADADATNIAVGDVLKIDSEEVLVTATSSSGGTTTVTITRGVNGTDDAAHVTVASIFYEVASTSANSFRVRKTVPVVAELTLPSTSLGSGDNTVAKFSITADSNEDVTLYSVNLTAAATVNTVQVNTDATNNSVKVGGTTYDDATVTPDDNNSTDNAMTAIAVDFSTPVTIAAGTSKTFEVIVDVTTLTGTDNHFTTKIVEDAAFGTTGELVWSDNANPVDPAATKANSYEVNGVPTSTQEISN